MTKKVQTTTFCITGELEKFKRIDAIVETRKDTKKAKRAKAFGTRVINEAEMVNFIKAGKFPVRSLN